jgi:hypothetical protein
MPVNVDRAVAWSSMSSPDHAIANFRLVPREGQESGDSEIFTQGIADAIVGTSSGGGRWSRIYAKEVHGSGPRLHEGNQGHTFNWDQLRSNFRNMWKRKDEGRHASRSTPPPLCGAGFPCRLQAWSLHLSLC